ncbi:MAG: hypothetical protein IKO73_01910 [Bacteroidaceae bacterium]|nr:hypothetical protein [Bacteroidaceae bacterium]
MRRLKKKIFYGLCGGTVAVLATVRFFCPSVVNSSAEACPADSVTEVVAEKPAPLVRRPHHRVLGVYSYDESFPDVQDVQIVAARRWGVKPVQNRQAAERRKQDLVYVGANPYYCIDKTMRQSIPYLVPRAADLLQKIGRNFIDSLYVKNIPMHRIIVSSVLRTEDDVARLRKVNGNASEQSCHRFGTTFDIKYVFYDAVRPSDGSPCVYVSDAILKPVLAEVLRDLREQGLCYVKHERKQSCFHITVR